VALGPYNPSEACKIGDNFLQAGFGVFMYPNGSFALNPFVVTIDNGQYTTDNFTIVPISKTELSVLHLLMCIWYEGNNKVRAHLMAYYYNSQGSIVTIFQYCNSSVPWPFSSAPYSAYTIVEAPKNPTAGNYFSMPQICGGKICDFSFWYISCGQCYLGPGKPQPNTEFEAQVDCLDSLENYNHVYAYLFCGHAGYKCCLWQFTYCFYDTVNGQTTHGL
jgi:hypothetical protein